MGPSYLKNLPKTIKAVALDRHRNDMFAISLQIVTQDLPSSVMLTPEARPFKR